MHFDLQRRFQNLQLAIFWMAGAVSGSMQSLQSASGNNSLTGSASLAKKFRLHALEARRCLAKEGDSYEAKSTTELKTWVCPVQQMLT